MAANNLGLVAESRGYTLLSGSNRGPSTRPAGSLRMTGLVALVLPPIPAASLLPLL
jgi:hypothetical protein